MEIIVKNVRLAFFNGYEPGSYEGKLSYGAQLIVDPKDTEQVKKLDAAMEACAKEKWGDKWKAIYADMKAKDRLCFRHGPKLSGNGTPYDGFEGKFYISCSAPENKPPMLIKRDKSISTARDGDLYAGCYADVKLNLWAQDNQYGKRINAQPLVFQFRAHGDAFAGGPPPNADDMDDLSDVGEEVEDLVG